MTLYIVALIIFTISASLFSRWLAARINLTADARTEYGERLLTKPGTIKGVEEAVFVKLYVAAHEPRWALYIPIALLSAALSTPLLAIALTAFWPVFVSTLDGGPWYDVGYYPWMFYMFFGFCGLWALCAAIVARIHHARAPEAFQPALARARGEPLDDVVIVRPRPKWAVKARPDPAPDAKPADKPDDKPATEPK
ncbi:hypothetical protein [uncultured Maricaulis sp.]|uniref:hypothetical protein n=1 Tax=uncultured Maricaulis sp. TaxID=174710 RepID=UPI0030D942F5|tara:strand:+ start:78321 stop:78908 length:588 start_codon:yes stop_codon:yes gene_type:complete